MRPQNDGPLKAIIRIMAAKKALVSTRLTGTLVRIVVAAAIGGSLLGFDTAVIAGAIDSLRRSFALTPVQLGVTVSAALWGTVIGAIVAGPMGRRWGGRISLMFLAICYVISAFGCAFSTTWAGLLLFRIVGGLGMGGSSVIAPVYIAEVAPADWRGRLVGTFQVNIVVGVLLAYLSNFLIGFLSLQETEWRLQLGIATLPALIFFTMLLGIPASPRWLAVRGRLDEAKAILLKIGSGNADSELREMLEVSRRDATIQRANLFQRRFFRPIVLAVTLAMFNQLLGINVVLYYLNDIFAMAGFDRESQNLQTVIVGAVMLAATFVAISLIDKAGRCTLLLLGSVGMAICLGGIAGIFQFHRLEPALVWLVLAYVAFFCVSQGTVIWVYLSEIFPTQVRSQGQSLGCTVHWVMNAILSAAFPILAARSRSGPFWLFCCVAIGQFVAVSLFFPETKGVSLEQLQREMEGNVAPALGNVSGNRDAIREDRH